MAVKSFFLGVPALGVKHESLKIDVFRSKLHVEPVVWIGDHGLDCVH